MSRLQIGRLAIEWSNDGRECMVAMDGQINEQTDLHAFADQLTERVVIDLAGVSFINSTGVREWLRLLRKLRQKQARVVLRRCSQVMTYQMSMILELAAGVEVESFSAPYLCEGCFYEGSVCLEVAAHPGLRRRMAPPQPCPECKAPMQLNEIPARYLLFLDGAATQ